MKNKPNSQYIELKRLYKNLITADKAAFKKKFGDEPHESMGHSAIMFCHNKINNYGK